MLLTLNRRNINYDESKEALRSLHEYVNILTDELNFVLCHLDQRNIPFIGKRFQEMQDGFSLMQTWQSTTDASIASSMAGLKLQADAQKASAELIAQIVDVGGNIRAASIIAAVNEADSSIKLTADHISLNGMTEINGVTKMNSLANISQTLTIGLGEPWGVINFPYGYIESRYEDNKRILELDAPDVLLLSCENSKSTNSVKIEGRAATLQTMAVTTADDTGFTDPTVNIVGTLGLSQDVFIGAWDLSNRELAIVIRVGSSNNFRRFILTATKEDNIFL